MNREQAAKAMEAARRAASIWSTRIADANDFASTVLVHLVEIDRRDRIDWDHPNVDAFLWRASRNVCMSYGRRLRRVLEREIPGGPNNTRIDDQSRPDLSAELRELLDAVQLTDVENQELMSMIGAGDHPYRRSGSNHRVRCRVRDKFAAL